VLDRELRERTPEELRRARRDWGHNDGCEPESAQSERGMGTRIGIEISRYRGLPVAVAVVVKGRKLEMRIWLRATPGARLAAAEESSGVSPHGASARAPRYTNEGKRA
jgi:hypothetical protein